MLGLLATNDIPGSLEWESIREVLANARTDLQILDDEVSRHLLELQMKQASVQKIADQHFMLIRGLPTEVLIHIFMFTISDDPSPFLPKDTPVLLGKVCRSWRAISRATPWLWSTIHMEHVDNKERGAMLSEWLKRSRNCSLTGASLAPFSR